MTSLQGKKIRDDDFKTGRPSALMGSSVDWIAEKVAVNKGKGHDDVAVAEIIKEALNKEISDAGLVPIIDQSVCDQTLRNITALVAAEKSVSIYKSSVKKV